MLAPFIMVDELIYSELAESFAADLRFPSATSRPAATAPSTRS